MPFEKYRLAAKIDLLAVEKGKTGCHHRLEDHPQTTQTGFCNKPYPIVGLSILGDFNRERVE